jgi:hypothetical protein
MNPDNTIKHHRHNSTLTMADMSKYQTFDT